MKRVVLPALVGVLALGAGLWAVMSAPSVDPVAAASAERGTVAPIALRPRSVDVEPASDAVGEPSEPAVAWERRVGAVRDQCGLAVQTGCEGDRCVSLASVPPLDHVSGWLLMTRRSPHLVAAVVAGDLGLPDRSLPCRDAIRGLGTTETLARAHGGGEVWCLTQNGEADRALCDRLSEELLGAAVGFEETVDRRVELRPPG